MSNFDEVRTFMKIFGQEIKTKAEFPEKKIVHGFAKSGAKITRDTKSMSTWLDTERY